MKINRFRQDKIIRNNMLGVHIVFTLNESATKSTKRELRTAIENKERLMLILDEELTYRLTFKKLNKSKAINDSRG